MAKFVALLVVVGVVLAILAFVGMSVEDAMKSVLSVLSIGAVLKSNKDEFATVYYNRKDENNGEGGFMAIIVILALFVFVILVVLPALQLQGNLNPGCAVIKTVACGN